MEVIKKESKKVSRKMNGRVACWSNITHVVSNFYQRQDRMQDSTQCERTLTDKCQLTTNIVPDQELSQGR